LKASAAGVLLRSGGTDADQFPNRGAPRRWNSENSFGVRKKGKDSDYTLCGYLEYSEVRKKS